MKSAADLLWDVTVRRRFRGTCCLHTISNQELHKLQSQSATASDEIKSEIRQVARIGYLGNAYKFWYEKRQPRRTWYHIKLDLK